MNRRPDRLPTPAAALTLAAACLAAVLAGVGAGRAGEPGARYRWLVGIDGLHERIDDNSDTLVEVDTGQDSGGFQVGYRLSPTLLLRLYTTGADHATDAGGSDLRVETGVLELSVLLRRGHRLRPYLCGGVGGARVSSQRDVLEYEATGPAASLGTGLWWRFARHWSLHYGLRVVLINWEEERATIHLGDTDVTTSSPLDTSGATLQSGLGVAFWF